VLGLQHPLTNTIERRPHETQPDQLSLAVLAVNLAQRSPSTSEDVKLDRRSPPTRARFDGWRNDAGDSRRTTQSRRCSAASTLSQQRGESEKDNAVQVQIG